MQIALQNPAALNTENIVSTAGKGNSLQSAAVKTASGEGVLPFSVIFTKMINKANQAQGSASSPGQISGNTADEGTVTGEDANMPLFVLKIEGPAPNQEKMKTAAGTAGVNKLFLASLFSDELEPDESQNVTLEIDLQKFLKIVQNSRIKGDKSTDSDGSDAATAFLSSLLQGIAAALAGLNGEETTMTPAETIRSLNESLSAGNEAGGNKVLLSLPQEMLQGFIANKNGQPHFTVQGMVTDPAVTVLSENNETNAEGQPLSTLMADPVTGEPAVRLVRLNTQAAGSSPQGALLTAAAGLPKANQTGTDVPLSDQANVENAETPSVNPLQHETLMKDAGERPLRDLLLKNHTSDATGTASSQTGASAHGEEPADLNRPGSVKSADAFKEMLVHEDKVKNAPVISGKESTQWVPLAGAASPQLSPESGSVVKGVFIPMEGIVQEAGALLEKGSGKVQMTLQPPSLGTINMEVLVRSNRVELVLTANHAEVQQLLQANSDQLKNALGNQGFQIDQMSVLLRRESFGFNLGGHSLWQDGSGQQQGDSRGSVTIAPMPETETRIPQRDYSTGIISIFA